MKVPLTVRELISLFQFEVVYGEAFLDNRITNHKLFLPGIEFYNETMKDNFTGKSQVQLIEHVILHYFTKKNFSINKKLINFLKLEFPCIIIRDKIFYKEHRELIHKFCHVPILFSPLNVTALQIRLESYIYLRLAPEVIYNDYVFMDVLGIGIILSGVRNSKLGAAIDLIERGHRIITEECLTVKRFNEMQLIGYNDNINSDNEINYFLELTSGEKISIDTYFGIKSVRAFKKIDLIIEFEMWDNTREYDRLGLDSTTVDILSVSIPKITIPVKEGRNLAVLVEATAINERAKKMGIFSAEEFCTYVQKMIQENKVKRSSLGMGYSTVLTPQNFIDKFDLTVIHGEKEKLLTTKIASALIYRPSLEFVGYFDVLDEENNFDIHLVTLREIEFILSQPRDVVEKALDNYLKYDFTCLIFTSDVCIPDFFKNLIEKHHKVALQITAEKNLMIAKIQSYLDDFFAKSVTLHGIFVEIYGFGVLIIGKSGIGKSEAALELIHRKHRLIADDKVRFSEKNTGEIVGVAEKIPYFMEIRGLGIIDVKTLYGVGAVKDSKRLDVIVNLKEVEDQEKNMATDYQIHHTEFLGKKIPRIDVHVFAGRNAATMIEIATMNVVAKNEFIK